MADISNAIYANTTMAITTGASGFGTDSWFSIMIIVVIVTFTLSVLVAALSSVQQFKRLKGVIKFFVDSFAYFIYGCVSLIVLAIPIALIYWEASNASQGNILPLSYTIIIILGYVAIAGIGYLAKKIVDRVKRLNKLAIKEEKNGNK